MRRCFVPILWCPTIIEIGCPIVENHRGRVRYDVVPVSLVTALLVFLEIRNSC